MTKEIKQVALTILKAAKSKWLTQAADVPAQERIFTKEIYLGVNDSPDNWKEITNAEKESIEASAKTPEEGPEE